MLDFLAKLKEKEAWGCGDLNPDMQVTPISQDS